MQNYEFTWTQKDKQKTKTKNQKQKNNFFDLEKEKLKEECSIAHKNMYEENDCEKIHILNNYTNTNVNFFGDDEDIVWD